MVKNCKTNQLWGKAHALAVLLFSPGTLCTALGVAPNRSPKSPPLPSVQPLSDHCRPNWPYSSPKCFQKVRRNMWTSSKPPHQSTICNPEHSFYLLLNFMPQSSVFGSLPIPDVKHADFSRKRLLSLKASTHRVLFLSQYQSTTTMNLVAIKVFWFNHFANLDIGNVKFNLYIRQRS